MTQRWTILRIPRPLADGDDAPWRTIDQNFEALRNYLERDITAGTLIGSLAGDVSGLPGSNQVDDISLLTTQGDMIRRGASAAERFGLGAVNTLLTSDGTDPGWETLTSLIDAALGNTRGDLLTRGASEWTVLAVGSAGTYLGSDGTDPSWSQVDHGGLAGLADDDHSQYHTDARALTWLGTRSTTDLPEGTNLYWTTARFDTQFNTYGSAHGDILYFTGSAWARLAPGTSGHHLRTNGVGSAPAWEAPPAAGVTDHGALTGLSDDDHSQYHNDTRANTWINAKGTTHGDIWYYNGSAWVRLAPGTSGYVLSTQGSGAAPQWIAGSSSDHGGLTGLADDDHSQYHNDTRGDARYYQKSEFINTSAGAGDAGKPVVLDAAGHIDATMINDADVDHGSIGGLADDDHTQYHTDARALTWLGTRSTTDLPEGTNLYYTQARFDTAFAAKSTTDLSEGTNLYWTTARFDTQFNTYGTAHGDILYYTGAAWTRLAPGTSGHHLRTNGAGAAPTWEAPPAAGVTDHGALTGLTDDDHTQYHTDARALTWLGTRSTTDLAEGTNLYYTQARFDTAFAAKSTTDLSEGTNLYYTQARFDTAFAAKSTTDLSEGTNLYYTQARFDTAFTAKDTDDLSEGATNLYYTDARVASYLAGLAVAHGDILYYNGAAWVRLAPGTSGQHLRTNGTGAAPSWESATAASYVSTGSVGWVWVGGFPLEIA